MEKRGPNSANPHKEKRRRGDPDKEAARNAAFQEQKLAEATRRRSKALFEATVVSQAYVDPLGPSSTFFVSAPPAVCAAPLPGKAIFILRSSRDRKENEPAFLVDSDLVWRAIKPLIDVTPREVTFIHRNNKPSSQAVPKTGGSGINGTLSNLVAGFAPGTDVLIFIRGSVGWSSCTEGVQAALRYMKEVLNLKITLYFWMHRRSYPESEETAFSHEHLEPLAGGQLGFGGFVDVDDLIKEQPITFGATTWLRLMKKINVEKVESNAAWREPWRNTLSKNQTQSMEAEIVRKFQQC